MSSSAAPGDNRTNPHLLAHSAKDNCAVAVVEGLTAGTVAFGVITDDDSTFEVRVLHDIPIGHKVALRDLKVGDTAIKYGQDIGRVVSDVGTGEHLHVQNVKTKRW